MGWRAAVEHLQFLRSCGQRIAEAAATSLMRKALAAFATAKQQLAAELAPYLGKMRMW